MALFSPSSLNPLWFILLAIVSANPRLSAATTLQLGDSTGAAGSTVSVPLRLNTTDVVSAAQIEVFTDPDVAAIATISGSAAGANHIVDSETIDEEGRTRVVVYSTRNDFLFSEALIDIQLVLRTSVGQNERALRVETVMMSDGNAATVNARLVPHAVFDGPDASVIYKMGDEVGGAAVAYGTNTDVARVDFLVDGWAVASDTEAPYEMNFPLEYFGNITISARAYDQEGNWYQSGQEVYRVDFPHTLQAWLDVFFSADEQADGNFGGLLADLDLDGNSTLLEYAMGLHPRRSDGPRESGFFQDPDTGLYHFGYLRPVGVQGITYTFQVSPDLDNWQNANGLVSTEVVPLNSYWELVEFTLDDLQEPREFGRVLIENTN